MARGGVRPGAGRKAKTNKPVIGRQIQELQKAQNVGRATVETFDAFEQLCNIAKLFINQAVEQQALKGTDQFERGFYNECLAKAHDTCKEIVKYQKPTFRAVALMDPMAIMAGANGQMIDAEATEIPPDQIEAARVYQAIMMGALPKKPTRGSN